MKLQNLDIFNSAFHASALWSYAIIIALRPSEGDRIWSVSKCYTRKPWWSKGQSKGSNNLCIGPSVQFTRTLRFRSTWYFSIYELQHWKQRWQLHCHHKPVVLIPSAHPFHNPHRGKWQEQLTNAQEAKSSITSPSPLGHISGKTDKIKALKSSGNEEYRTNEKHHETIIEYNHNPNVTGIYLSFAGTRWSNHQQKQREASNKTRQEKSDHWHRKQQIETGPRIFTIRTEDLSTHKPEKSQNSLKCMKITDLPVEKPLWKIEILR